MKSLARLLHFVRPYLGRAIGALALLLGMVAADLLVPRLTQSVIDRGIVRGDLRAVIGTSLLILLASVISTGLAIGNAIYSVHVGQHFAADLRKAFVRKVQTLSFGNLDRLQTGQLMVRATSDISLVQMIVTMALRILTRAPLWVLGSVVMLAINSPTLVPLAGVLMAIVLAMIGYFTITTRPLFTQVQAKLDRLNTVLQENLAGIRVVKAFVRDDYENQRFDVANQDLMHQNIRVLQRLAFLFPTMQLVINIGIAGILWIGGVRVVQGQASIGEIVASFNYLTFSIFPLLMLAGMMGPLSAADASAARILEVLDSAPEVPDTGRQGATAQTRGRVAFENVTFSYNGQESSEPVLNGIDLVAEPGERVAILGSTGAGKSTLINLIPRFYDATSGRVTLDGVDVRDIALRDLRAQVAIAMQDAVLFSGTVRDNIRYGRPDAPQAEVERAARAAQAHDFIMGFPDGYDTIVGERGVTLSGGQKQRLSIARALLVQPKVLILDDSTSAVDVETERRIEAALETLMQERTAFVVAQRISTVLAADKIIVLDGGRIAANGSHAELMASSPIYREIYNSQLGDGSLLKEEGL